MIVLKWVVVAVALLALLGAAVSLYGAQQWRTLTTALNARLEASRRDPSPARYDARELQDLPAPVPTDRSA